MTDITSKDITNRVPKDIREIIIIHSPVLNEIHKDNVEALIQAIKIISKKVILKNKVQFIICGSTFGLELKNGTLVFNRKKDIIGINIENLIFIDFEKLVLKSFDAKVVSILEEFVHAIMNVSDEILTSQIVCLLYPAVSCNDDGQYIFDPSR